MLVSFDPAVLTIVTVYESCAPDATGSGLSTIDTVTGLAGSARIKPVATMRAATIDTSANARRRVFIATPFQEEAAMMRRASARFN